MIMPTSTAVITAVLLVFAASTTKSLPAGIYSLAIHQRNEPRSLLGASYTRRRANETYRETPASDSHSQTDYSASMPYSMRDVTFPESWMYPRLNTSESGSNLQRRHPRPLSDQTNLPPLSTPSSTSSNVIPPNTSVTFISRPTNDVAKKRHRKTKKGGRRINKHNTTENENS